MLRKSNLLFLLVISSLIIQTFSAVMWDLEDEDDDQVRFRENRKKKNFNRGVIFSYDAEMKNALCRDLYHRQLYKEAGESSSESESSAQTLAKTDTTPATETVHEEPSHRGTGAGDLGVTSYASAAIRESREVIERTADQGDEPTQEQSVEEYEPEIVVTDHPTNVGLPEHDLVVKIVATEEKPLDEQDVYFSCAMRNAGSAQPKVKQFLFSTAFLSGWYYISAYKYPKPAKPSQESEDEDLLSLDGGKLTLDQETASRTEEKPGRVEEKPSRVEEKPSRTEEKPGQVEEKPSRVEEKPSRIEEKPSRVPEKPSRIEEKPSQVEEKPSQVPKPSPDQGTPSLAPTVSETSSPIHKMASHVQEEPSPDSEPSDEEGEEEEEEEEEKVPDEATLSSYLARSPWLQILEDDELEDQYAAVRATLERLATESPKYVELIMKRNDLNALDIFKRKLLCASVLSSPIYQKERLEAAKSFDDDDEDIDFDEIQLPVAFTNLSYNNQGYKAGCIPCFGYVDYDEDPYTFTRLFLAPSLNDRDSLYVLREKKKNDKRWLLSKYFENSSILTHAREEVEETEVFAIKKR